MLCSTATRTRQTAERVLAGLADPPPVDYRRAIYGASPERMLKEIASVDDEVASLMVVGHNPTFSALAIELATPADFTAAGLEHSAVPTTALAVYRFPAKRWSEVAFGTGKLLGCSSRPTERRAGASGAARRRRSAASAARRRRPGRRRRTGPPRRCPPPRRFSS